MPSPVVEDMVVEVEEEAMVEVDLVEVDSLAEEDLEAMVVVEVSVMEVVEEDMAEVVEDLGEVLEEDLAEVLAAGAMVEAMANKVGKCHQSWSEAGARLSSGGVERQLNGCISQISYCNPLSTQTVPRFFVLDDVSIIIYIINEGIIFSLPHINDKMFALLYCLVDSAVHSD